MESRGHKDIVHLMRENVIWTLFALYKGKSYVHRISHDTYLSDGTIRDALKEAMRFKLVKKSIEVGPRGRKMEFYELTPAGKELTELGFALVNEMQSRLEKILGNGKMSGNGN